MTQKRLKYLGHSSLLSTSMKVIERYPISRKEYMTVEKKLTKLKPSKLAGSDNIHYTPKSLERSQQCPILRYPWPSYSQYPLTLVEYQMTGR